MKEKIRDEEDQTEISLYLANEDDAFTVAKALLNNGYSCHIWSEDNPAAAESSSHEPTRYIIEYAAHDHTN